MMNPIIIINNSKKEMLMPFDLYKPPNRVDPKRGAAENQLTFFFVAFQYLFRRL